MPFLLLTELWMRKRKFLLGGKRVLTNSPGQRKISRGTMDSACVSQKTRSGIPRLILRHRDPGGKAFIPQL